MIWGFFLRITDPNPVAAYNGRLPDKARTTWARPVARPDPDKSTWTRY